MVLASTAVATTWPINGVTGKWRSWSHLTDQFPQNYRQPLDAIVSAVMTYMQALTVGWSIYWRQAVWTVCVMVVAAPLFHLARQSPDWLRTYAGIVLLLLVFCVAFPRTILRVLQIRYLDFRLEPRRAGNSEAEVRFWEAALLSMIVNFVPLLAAPVLRLYIGAVPVLGRLVTVLFPILVGMPLTGWLLTGVRIFSLRIEIR